MLRKHSDIIKNNLFTLVENTDLTRIIPHLESKHVLNQETIFRILNPADDVKSQTTNLYAALLKRGPQTFALLRDALQESDHLDLANLLTHMETEGSNPVNRSPSLNSVGTVDSGDSDERAYTSHVGNLSPELPMKSSGPTTKNAQPFTSNNVSSMDSYSSTSSSKSFDVSRSSNCKPKSAVVPCKLPDYFPNIGPFINEEEVSPGESLRVRLREGRAVNVVNATEWKDVGPFHYKMNSYPRGCALVVNNVEFEDGINFPKRKGAENDERRITQMLEQLFFNVEFHENKSRMQMIEIVKTFSKKEELKEVDCVLIIFMSHGAEGASEEDTEIIGVDGIGFKTREIVSYFSNDRCKALIHKPKVFIFQACSCNIHVSVQTFPKRASVPKKPVREPIRCPLSIGDKEIRTKQKLLPTAQLLNVTRWKRGVLRDGGVLIERRRRRFSERTEFDGRKIDSQNFPVRIRSISDVFIAYAVPPGRPANRDIFSGTWFIQTIVDVFSENAWQHDLEDMLKMVDNKIKNLDNLEVRNFQAVATSTIGWNKKLYFNPGLRKTMGEESKSAMIEAQSTDVVNCPESSVREEKPGGEERKGEEEEDDEEGNDCSKRSCLPLAKCVVS